MLTRLPPISAPACLWPKFGLLTGPVHYMILNEAVNRGWFTNEHLALEAAREGFVDTLGVFLDRDEAYSRAIAINQIDKKAYVDSWDHAGMDAPDYLETYAFDDSRLF